MGPVGDFLEKGKKESETTIPELPILRGLLSCILVYLYLAFFFPVFSSRILLFSVFICLDSIFCFFVFGLFFLGPMEEPPRLVFFFL